MLTELNTSTAGPQYIHAWCLALGCQCGFHTYAWVGKVLFKRLWRENHAQ